MPTARELLEQADALMRRNRAIVDDDIPVLTDAVPSAQEARSRFAPPPLRPVEAPTPASDVHDDVPLLTDEVEEIEAAAIDAAVDEGEPSVWLDFQDAEPSVIGDAPDSIAMVPPVDLRRSPPAPDVGDFDGLDEELAGAIDSSPAAAKVGELDAPDEEPPSIPPGPDVEEVDGLDEEPAAAIASMPPGPDVEEFDGFDEEPAAAIASSPAEEESPPPSAAATSALESPAGLPPHTPPPAFTGIAGGAAALLYGEMATPSAATATPVSISAQPAPALPAPALPAPALPAPALPAPAPAAPDAAHWEAMAEEIRMQVLQRIDLFTDTGLRTQLGARLQPIVDRASADLVATINQHVGELLREYVAEAIEREIDNWRRDH